LEPEISRRVITLLKNNILWSSLEHLRPTEEEIKVARGVKTNLTGLSRKKLYCLAKFSEWMTFVQVRLYLPNLI
jgi:NTE family protein